MIEISAGCVDQIIDASDRFHYKESQTSISDWRVFIQVQLFPRYENRSRVSYKQKSSTTQLFTDKMLH